MKPAPYRKTVTPGPQLGKLGLSGPCWGADLGEQL